MYVRVCVCVGQTLLSYARGFPRGPKTYRRQQDFFLIRLESTFAAARQWTQWKPASQC